MSNREGKALVYSGYDLSSLRSALDDWWGHASAEEQASEHGQWVWSQLGLMADVECGDLGTVSPVVDLDVPLRFQATIDRTELAGDLQEANDARVVQVLAPAIAEQLLVALDRANMKESLQDISVQVLGDKE